MKFLILLLFSTISFVAKSQTNIFPQNWLGNWKGELQWYKTGQKDPQKINMELRIHATDSINTWTWQIIYGAETKDNRPYKLFLKDSVGIHWVIDENNGIVLDQYWVGNKLCGVFTVQNNTIINSYWMEKDELHIEFYSVSAKPINTTGNATVDIPNVDSYKIGSYQKAVLKKQ